MINYHISTRIWLSLEEYYNSGITPQQIENVIKKMRDPFRSLCLRCQPMGVNGNFIVEYSGPSNDAPIIVCMIEEEIDSLH